jgi:two-component system chemotaxis response regulator CheB
MPELDGFAALPHLLAQKPDLVVIVVSTLTRRNAETSVKALALGATDCITKPESRRGGVTSAGFRRELIARIEALGRRHIRVPDVTPPRPGMPAAVRRAPMAAAAPDPIRLRRFSSRPPQVLAIGASTGGPQALTTLLARLGPVIERAPVLITQHMPPTFTAILAEHLARACRYPVCEAPHGGPVRPGVVYLAPGGRHMRVTQRRGEPLIALDDGPLINFCKPAVDPLFRSVAAVWGDAVLGLILTGMGADGRQGAAAIVAAGGSVIAQDEPTSAIWGMPGAAARAGLCAAVLPIDRIAPKVIRLFRGGRA